MARISGASMAPLEAPVAAGATLTVDPAKHRGKTIALDTAAGSVVTLPAATGTGDRYNFVVSVLATSNSHKVQVTGTDIMQGIAIVLQDGGDTNVAFETAADSDTVTLNRTTMGSTIRGETIEVEDIASGLWRVRVMVAGTGTEASPFSAAV